MTVTGRALVMTGALGAMLGATFGGGTVRARSSTPAGGETGGPRVAGCRAAGALAAPADLPAQLRVPGDARLFLRLRAEGTQIYTCQKDPGGRWVFVLKGPEARLISDRCAEVGRHLAGPRWQLDGDGSAVIGKKVAEADRPGSIPWLLLSAASSSGTGKLSPVRFIQRVQTEGGLPPKDGCDQARAGRDLAVPYRATYLYYRSPTPGPTGVSNSPS
jgi:hypothetical protein